MRASASVLALVACLAAGARCYEVHFNRYSVVNVTGPTVSAGSFQEAVRELEVKKYFGGETQIETVTSLPVVKYITMSQIGQELLPRFSDMPLLKTINLDANELLYIKQNSFDATAVEELHLKRNKITFAERESFGPQLKILHLECNRISKLSANWFQNPGGLEKLALGGNRIETLVRDQFAAFKQLYWISLAFNQIKTIEAGAFSNRNRFIGMHLQNNRLTELTPDVFPAGKVTIRELYLSNNDLTYLSADLMARVKVTEVTLIRGNPWQCPCYDEIRNWVPWHRYRLTPSLRDHDGEPRCVSAVGSFADNCIAAVDSELIQLFRKEATPPKTATDFCACTVADDYCP